MALITHDAALDVLAYAETGDQLFLAYDTNYENTPRRSNVSGTAEVALTQDWLGRSRTNIFLRYGGAVKIHVSSKVGDEVWLEGSSGTLCMVKLYTDTDIHVWPKHYLDDFVTYE